MNLADLFDPQQFMPHGHCYFWQPGVLWLNAISDTLIALAYFSIPLALIVLVNRRRDLAFSWMFVLFGVFILACGATHVMAIITIWKPYYWLDGMIKAITAVASIGTAILVWPLIPQALALPSPKQLAAANSLLRLNVDRHAAVATFSQSALLGEDVDDLIYSAMRITKEQLKLELCSFYELDAFGERLILRSGFGWNPNDPCSTQIDHPENSDAAYTLKSKKAVIVTNLKDEARFSPSPFLLRNHAKSGICVIVHGFSKPHGIVRAFSLNLREFSEEEIHFLQAVANVLGIAIERKRAESQVARTIDRLADSNRDLEAFTYSVSHDLRAPLRSIDGFSRLLLEDFGKLIPDEGKRFVNIIRQNTTQMGHLIDDLLLFSRLGKKAIQRHTVDMKNLVEEALESIDLKTDDRNIEIESSNLSNCIGDPALIKQVMVNLLSNAVKYTRGRKHTKIEIGSLDDPQSAIYFVRDNGIGFDMRYAEKLFGVFQRLHFAEEYEGNGVGLAIVQRIVSKHGGKVWANAVPNEGAVFYFSIPWRGDRDD